jgi:uncharacterized membrane protein YhaH (DUF805 family)
MVIFLVIVTVAIIGGGASILAGDLSGLGAMLFILILAYIPLLWIGLALGAKRLHDRNKSAWWLVIFWIVPAILQGIGEHIDGIGLIFTLGGLALSIWGLVEIGFLRGTVGPNQYGPDPLEGPR